MSETISIDFSQPLPLFPLPNCVLLPHATIPLRVFEPRYRRMVSDALDARPLIAMATFEGRAWKQEYEGNPPLRPHVCVGYIIRHEKLPDGRYNLLLQGVCRARIRREVPHTPYRLAQLEPMERRAPLEIDLSDSRQRVESLLQDPLLKELAAVHSVHNWLNSEIPTAVMVDLVIMTVSDNVEERYGMLAEPDPGNRARWLERLLRQTRQTLATAERFRPEEQADGATLN